MVNQTPDNEGRRLGRTSVWLPGLPCLLPETKGAQPKPAKPSTH